MNYTRQYVQFNDLVFDGVEVITSDDLTHSFKNNRKSYTHAHGDYNPIRERRFLESASFSMTIKLKMKKLPCDVRPFYYDFALGQLNEPGKLWAVHNNTLEWAWAELNTFGDSQDTGRDTIEIDVEVYLPEGLWHKANKQKTFLKPWDICEFMDCYDFKEVQPCRDAEQHCCDCGKPMELGCKCCDCEALDKDMALCYHDEKTLQKAYGCNGLGYRIVYDCEASARHFGITGQKMCGDCGTIIGNLYSDTVLPTDGITITLVGHTKDPYIEINGNGNKIKGEFENLTIYPDGTATYNCDCEIAPDDWVIPEGNTYGWLIHQGNNKVIIETGNCCGVVCAYISADPLTL